MVSSDEFVTKMQFAFILTSSWCNRIDSTTNAGTPPADDFPAEVRAPPAKAIWKEPPAKPPPVAHTAYLRKEPPPKKAPPPAPGQFVSGMRRQVVTQGPEQIYHYSVVAQPIDGTPPCGDKSPKPGSPSPKSPPVARFVGKELFLDEIEWEER